ncbi:hypothetical protein N7493_000583 [Penicillium malachiteum]|uniref:Uncharacterized protein n=1 Tax=Penicillium malachiteum TaxID=1324776 RepID=A0AAD6N0Z6_9EURO|nr:hypothetical protein N7493_000583 [Penicillium malachiteum]
MDSISPLNTSPCFFTPAAGNRNRPHAPGTTSQPIVPPKPDGNEILVELLIFNGAPFKDHWAYWVCSRDDPLIGVKVHVTGDVRTGFEFQAKRSHSLYSSTNLPSKRVPLQWVSAHFFDEAMFNYGIDKDDDTPIGPFEVTARLAEPPGKTLNIVDERNISERPVRRRIIQRDCQTWVCESSDKLVEGGIFKDEVAAYLRAITQ